MVAIRPATRRFTVEEYYRMADAGVLHHDDRVELIDGEIIEMAPIGSRHASCVGRLTRLFAAGAGADALVWVQNPVRLDDFSEPEPDVMLLRPRPDQYAASHPGPSDVLLLVEVCDTTQVFDRTEKVPRYAAAGIAEVWLVDLDRALVEVYSEPGPAGYEPAAHAVPGEVIAPGAAPGLAVAVADILP